MKSENSFFNLSWKCLHPSYFFFRLCPVNLLRMDKNTARLTSSSSKIQLSPRMLFWNILPSMIEIEDVWKIVLIFPVHVLTSGSDLVWKRLVSSNFVPTYKPIKVPILKSSNFFPNETLTDCPFFHSILELGNIQEHVISCTAVL